ncbi:alpha/beta hydrolase [Caulobacter mirabilis]|uniref:Alpha/beta hydrolase n=2 Tax=Caulobacter mirabilis TaxID=69666 RepID=A0A2D2B4F3_9CAUL|nr:alpha/beta hydrolase [Caulobacter mirabilis]
MAALEFGPADRPLDVVFLHANGFNAGTYRSIFAPLGDQLRILAVDQRGHGRTTLPAQPFVGNVWRQYGDDLLALLDAVGETPTVLAGHSMGGTACLLASAKCADAAKRLVLFDPVIITPERAALFGEDGMRNSPLAVGALKRRATFADRQAAFDGYRGRGAFKTWPEESLRDYLADGLVEAEGGGMRLACAPTWESANFSTPSPDAVGGIPDIRANIRILKAEIGSTAQFEIHEPAVLAAGAEIEVVPGTSHFLPMERPDLVRAELLKAAR